MDVPYDTAIHFNKFRSLNINVKTIPNLVLIPTVNTIQILIML